MTAYYCDGCEAVTETDDEGLCSACEYDKETEVFVPPDTTVCVCPPEHTIAKLGHCHLCAYKPPSRSVGATEDMKTGVIQMFIYPPTDCVHDFTWATYADHQYTSGVCRCGLEQWSYDTYTRWLEKQ